MGKKERTVEVLAPAGSYDSFIAACQNGANAIYMGLDKFNARTMAKNFDIDTYIECINYAHIRGIKVYLTLNTLMYNDEIKEALQLLLKLYSNGLDAVILQDIGLSNLIHNLIPDLKLHASTQMSVYTLSQVKLLESLGFSRVVLARELSIEEIEYICKNTNIEIEVFVHGALCVSYSGQCLLSSSIGNRSANRGKCAQPCRMKYTLCDSHENEVVKDTYIMSKKDIFGLDYLDRLIEAGVTSLKIEGRNKIPEYVAGVTGSYRKYVDRYFSNKSEYKVDDIDKQNLTQLFNRNGICDGYFNGVRYKDSITLLSPKNTGRYLGKVINQKGMYIKIKLSENIDLHDGFEIYSQDKVISNIVTCIKDDKFVTKNKEAKSGEYVWIGDVSSKVKFGSEVYKTSSDKLNKRYRKSYENNIQNRRVKMCINLYIKADKNVCFDILKNDIITKDNVGCKIDYIPEVAIKKSITKQDILDNFLKTKDTPIDIEIKNITLDDNLFIPVSKLNDIRKNIINKILEIKKVNIDVSKKEKGLDKFLNDYISKYDINVKEESKISSLYIYNFDVNKDYISFYKEKYNKHLDRIYIPIYCYYKYEKIIKEKYIGKLDVYINIPNVTLKVIDSYILENLEKFLKDGISGFLLGSLAYIEKINSLKDKYKFKVIADYSLNISNIYSALFLTKLGFDTISPSYDISITDIEEMSKYVNIEIVNELTCVMTSRYCILGSFVGDRKNYNSICKKPCQTDEYILKDSYGYKYNIVCDNIDCIMRIVKRTRNINLQEYDIKHIQSIRNCIIK